MPSATVLVVTVLAPLIYFIGRYIFVSITSPYAPGPFAARWSNLWYLYKALGGRFERWNIEAHATSKVVRVGPRTYSIDDPAAASIIYGITSPMLKTSWYDWWADPSVENHNLFSSRDRSFHSAMRKKVAGMYSMSTIKSYEPHVDRCIHLLLQQFDEIAASGKVINLQHWMQCYAFDVIGEITFGNRVGFLESGGLDIDNIMHCLENTAAFCTFGGMQPWLAPLWFLLYGSPVKGMTAFGQRLKKSALKDENVALRHGETFVDKLDAVRQQSPAEYDKYHLENVFLANVAAGSDTTSIALTSALYYATSTKGVSEKLRKEVSSEITASDTLISFDQAISLPYLQQVIKEASRVHPATGLPMWREVVGDGANIAGVHFPPGSIVGINTWVAHANKDVFGEDAAEFRPERWDSSITSSAQLSTMEKYYMPFGAGTRSCIGRHISHLEMVKVIPELLRRYDFECTSGKMEWTNHWFVRPHNVMVKLRRRASG